VKDASRRKNVVVQDVFLKPRGKARRAKSHGGAPGGSIVWPPGFAESSENQGERDLVVLFWSGGKDSFLSLSHLYASYAAREEKRMPQVVLLTTIDPGTNAVPVQRIDVQTIVAQAEALELPLYLVAVGLGGGYAAKVDEALKQVPAKVSRDRITTLAFGDLHLEDIRAWREHAFAKQYDLLFPVWKKDYKTELLPALTKLCAQTQATITYSTIDSQELKQQGWEAGMPYKWEDVEALNATKSLMVDLMGESGEFHTCVKFPGMK
jgi:ATP-binding cassette subfamily B (MDR/TAP) protein 1